MQSAPTQRLKEPLISDHMIKRITIWVSIIAAATIALNFLGHWYSANMLKGAHTDKTTPIDVFIGPDHLRLPMNVVRFPEQRVTGETETISLYLLWPSLEGYSQKNSALFNQLAGDQKLIMVQLSQATMTLDMSGRLKPIYSRLFEGNAIDGPFGLKLNHFKPSSGYGDEVMLTADDGPGIPFAARCLLPAKSIDVTGADCQRDVAVGNDLSLLYRFPSTLLPQWRAIDAAVTRYIESHLVDDASQRRGRISQ